MAAIKATARRVGRLYRRGDTWWADYRDAKGRRHRETLHTQDVKVARERLRQRELAGPADRAADRKTLADAMKHLLDTVYVGRPAGTVSCYRQKARHLIRLLGSATPIVDLDKDDIHAYRKARIEEEAAEGTIHKELVVLRRALAEQGIVGVVPKVSARYVPRTKFLEPAQLSAVLGRLNEKRKLWVVAACFAGMRDSELNRLQWEDVDLERGWIRVRGSKTKGSFRHVPITPQLLPWLTAAAPDPRVGPVVETWTNRRRDICVAYWKVLGLKVPNHRKKESEAGMPRLSPNDLRRTFASWMKQAGVDSLAVAHLLGHSSTRMVELVYGKLNAATYQAAVATLPACDTGVPHESAQEARKSATGTDGCGARKEKRAGTRLVPARRGCPSPELNQGHADFQSVEPAPSPASQAPNLTVLPGGRKS